MTNINKSLITDYSKLKRHVTIVEASAGLRAELFDTTHGGFGSFKELFIDFLQGKGIPLPQEFEDAREGFDDSVDLSNIEEEEFRPKTFAFASTGSPLINEETMIYVRISCTAYGCCLRADVHVRCISFLTRIHLTLATYLKM